MNIVMSRFKRKVLENYGKKIELEPLEAYCDYCNDGRSFHRFILPRLSDSGASNYYAFNWTPNSTNYVVLYSRRISLYQKCPKIHVPTGIVCGHLAFRILFCIWNQYHPVQGRHIQSDKRDVSTFYRSSGHVDWRFESRLFFCWSGALFLQTGVV